MSQLNIADLAVSYGQQRVLHGISFAVNPGERLCLLGPSGCGKTTTLQVVAGFLTDYTGTVSVDGRDLSTLPPERRNFGIVFQNYALFPHLTVFDNVAFGLRMRRIPEAEIGQRVASALDLVQLRHKAQMRPRMLSGGEQQRIAFARAVAIEPSLLLLDEPFSNLDARLRQVMRTELLELLQQLGIATILVTHDQEEAMAIADRIVVMNSGRIEQTCTPHEVYSQPASKFVARFLGETNMFHGAVAASNGGATLVDIPGFGQVQGPAGQVAVGSRQDVLVRPERIRVMFGEVEPQQRGVNRAVVQLERVLYLGHRTEYYLRAGDIRFTAWDLKEADGTATPGDRVVVEWDQQDTMLFEPESSHGAA